MSRSISLRVLAAALLTAGAATALTRSLAASDEASPRRGLIVVANRASGSVSVIDPLSDEVTGTHPLPPGARAPEPMYVVDGGQGRVLVGDRANSRIVVLDRFTFDSVGEVPAGSGVFHMWANEHQLWVNNDVDRTSAVYRLRDLQRVATVPMPADLVAAGGRPHDVVLGRGAGTPAYVSILGVAGTSDYVVQFDTETFQEIGRAPVGKDPHLSLNQRRDQLFVPAQGSGLLHILDSETLEALAVRSIPGAHGAALARDGQRFYTTNLPGGGRDALFTVDTKRQTVVGEPVDAPFAAPHNIALTPDGRRLYVSHSGPSANQVSVYRLDASGRPVRDRLREVSSDS